MLHAVWIGLVVLIVCSNYHIISGTTDYIYHSIDSVPHNRVGLVLGTSRYLRSGGSNPYFRFRINAAAQLYHAGKIKYLIVSGDNSLHSYNEPQLMKEALKERGVPGNRIYADYAGFRTLDSVVRSKEVFGQKKLTIITQEFHGRRAVFIGRHKGIEAVAFAAGSVPAEFGLKVLVREVFAKVKAVLDVYVFHTQPRFLGEAVVIPD
ncbi:MAG: YdcF family protein [Spirochaetia bacterium]|nr:YdcF family protein [Spirochaetia bacterium]